MYLTSIKEKRDHKFEREPREVYCGWNGKKGRGKRYAHIISKN